MNVGTRKMRKGLNNSTLRMFQESVIRANMEQLKMMGKHIATEIKNRTTR